MVNSMVDATSVLLSRVEGFGKKIKIVRFTIRLYEQNEDVKITLEDAELPHLQIILNEH